MTREVKTTCPYCGVGCGLIASCGVAGDVVIKPDPAHPANFGRICSKGAALDETLDHKGRLLHPMVDGKRTNWDTALFRAAEGFTKTIAKHGPNAVAFYVSGQLLTEDYYVANKLMKGFIGSANIDTNSRLCMASSTAGHKRAFGSDSVPGNYQDLDEADLVIFAGSNAAWCHPVLYQRIMAAREKNPTRRMVIIDPRRTATCEGADLHLALKPGSDTTLFNGLLMHLAAKDQISSGFVADHTTGLDPALAVARLGPERVEDIATACGLATADVKKFFDWFAKTERTVTLYSQGINQSSAGTDKVNAILNCHLVTGRIGRPGMGPFSLTGQPNAMGGREVGGMANQLAAHMNIETASHRNLVQKFWTAPVIADTPGLKAVDMFQAVADGKIKAIWIVATNPVVSLPDAGRVAGALAACPLVVVSDCMAKTDTTAHADVLLPALTWGEKNGTVTNSERRISRQRAFLDPPGEAKADWWAFCEVAKRMGFVTGFRYQAPADIFREHAALSGHQNNGTRSFDISGLALLDDAGYDALAPIQWPVTNAQANGTARLFTTGKFFNPDGRAQFVAVPPHSPANAPSHERDRAYPLVLNTGRTRDHWHSMTRSGASPKLSAHMEEPTIAIHPNDATAYALKAGNFARLVSRWGEMTARIATEPGQIPGQVFVPIHWNNQFTNAGCVANLVNPVTDPVSGQPELKHTPVAIKPVSTSWQALALTRNRTRPAAADYWTCARGNGFWRHHLAGRQTPVDWDAHARMLLPDAHKDAEWISYRDAASGIYRYACFMDGRLEASLFVADVQVEEAFDWIGQLFAAESVTALERATLLSGQPPAGRKDIGAIVCACFSIGCKQIASAIALGGLTSLDEIGESLGAGTNCGSCKPELSRLLEKAATPATQAPRA
ncbi:MAG: nitrate reductase [Rhodospirillaceae bacterium]|nr:MAG: nitrate reductase [Rhodospirillaceae bacterium]